MAHSITTQLMFEGAAGEAIDWYLSAFEGARLVSMEKQGEGLPEDKVHRAVIKLGNFELALIDSPVSHDFGFTPASSLFVECESETELDGLFTKLSKDGEILMPTDNYGFSQRFCWFNDRFGVSWQLNLV